MRKLIILSGLPGSGKTTIAKKMVSDHEARGERACICSADDYFIEDGKYVFRAEELEAAHTACQMSAERAMANGYDLVVVDNTNTSDWERWPYVKLAEKYQYEVTVQIIGGSTSKDVETYLARQVHGVPREKVEQMAARLTATSTQSDTNQEN